MIEDALIAIGGPTASGKSALALALAERFGGAVINADSMQVYRELGVLTARPDDGALARAPHALYGFLSASERCSAGRWRAAALEAIAAARQAGLLPVLVGGTGLYLRALLDGLSEVPDIPPAVKARVQALKEAGGLAAIRARLAERDPAMMARLRPSDTQRQIRALEVIEATGRSLASFQDTGAATRPADTVIRVVLEPPRGALRAACDRRFAAMLDRGALAEVEALLALGLDPSLPAMKAVGVRELGAYLAGRMTLAHAIRDAQAATRQYAKRQQTWFRHQMPGAERVPALYVHDFFEDMERLVARALGIDRG
jgi:tRNA dimethylallyltransferase